MDRSGTRRTRGGRALLVRCLLALLVLAAPSTFPPADAAFTASTSDTGNLLSTTDIAAPSGFAATQTCSTPAITFRAATSASSPSGGTLVLPVPPGTQAGDILIAHVTNRYDASSGLTVSNGTWTAIGARTTRGSGASGITGAAYWKLATASEPTSYTVTLGGGNTSDMAGGLATYTGVHTTSPVNDVVVTSGSGTSIALPSLSPTVPNVLLVDAITKEDEAQAAPTGSTQRWRAVSPNTGTNQGSTVGDKAVAATGPTGSRTAAGALNSNWISHSFALRPAAATPSASLTWTPSSTSGATGYTLERVVSGSVARTWTVAPISSGSTTDGPLVNGTAYTYRLLARSGTWVSPTVTTTLTPSC